MTTPQDAVLARRRLTNKFIAAHEAARLKPFFAADARVIAGDGSLILGAEAILSAFAAQFAEPGFIAYVRTPASVEVDQSGERAAEAGRWVGSWKTGGEMSGTYLAAWRKIIGQWVIETELYVTLAAK